MATKRQIIRYSHLAGEFILHFSSIQLSLYHIYHRINGSAGHDVTVPVWNALYEFKKQYSVVNHLMKISKGLEQDKLKEWERLSSKIGNLIKTRNHIAHGIFIDWNEDGWVFAKDFLKKRADKVLAMETLERELDDVKIVAKDLSSFELFLFTNL